MNKSEASVSAFDVVSELEARAPSLPAVKLHKLLYYCQAWHLAWTGQPLFRERIEAWVNGPVVAQVWRGRDDRDRSGPSPAGLPESGVAVVDYVMSRYGTRTGAQLIGDTHQEAPWLEARSGLGPNARSNRVISTEAMRAFFLADPAADQAWFWQAGWRDGELEAEHQVLEGRTRTFADEAALLDYLEP